MKKITWILMILMVLLSVLFMGCEFSTESSTNSDAVLEKQTEQAMQEMNATVGMPAITNFQERKLAKMIFELRDKIDLITYAYITTMNGDLIFIGKCIGFGLPYSVQYTNPIKLVRADLGEGWGEAPVPQVDPNGLFMPEGLSATWLMMINPETGEAEPVYIEQEILVSPFPLHQL